MFICDYYYSFDLDVGIQTNESTDVSRGIRQSTEGFDVRDGVNAIIVHDQLKRMCNSVRIDYNAMRSFTSKHSSDMKTNVVVWEYEGDDGLWHAMEAVSESCFRGIYEYNLQTLMQTNLETMRARPIRKTTRKVNLERFAQQNDEMIDAILKHATRHVRPKSFDIFEGTRKKRRCPSLEGSASFDKRRTVLEQQIENQQQQLNELQEQLHSIKESSERQRRRKEELERRIEEQAAEHQRKSAQHADELSDRASQIVALKRESCELLKRNFELVVHDLLHPAPDAPSPSRYAGDAGIAAFVAQLLQETATEHRRSNDRDSPVCHRPKLVLDGVDLVFDRARSARFVLSLSQAAASDPPADLNPLLRLRSGADPAAGCVGALLRRAVLLWHGSDNRSVEGIVEDGVRLAHTGRGSGSMFGRGFYLAEHASKADLYCGSRPHARPDAAMKMLLCAVGLGRAHTARKPLRDMPVPKIPGPNGGCVTYDSVVAESRAGGGAVDHREYAVFSEQQALPVAVVAYHHDRACRCSRCL